MDETGLDEFGLIDLIVRELGEQALAAHVVLGPGDDAAVIAPSPGTHAVTSIDTQVAGRHFPANSPADLIGYRAVMSSVSDLAAMAANPKYALVAVTLEEASASWVRDLTGGIKAAALECGIAICGGNLTRGPLSLTLSVHGEVPAGGAVLRSGAQAGDIIQVSGPLGGANACVREQRFELGPELDPIQQSYFRPRARTDLVDVLQNAATACADISDGLLQDLSHILSASGCGAEVQAGSIPRTLGANEEDVLRGGGDYELIATAPSEMPGFTSIGRIVDEQVLRVDGEMVDVAGFDHFRA